MLVCLILSQRSLRLSSVLFILFTLFCSSEAIFTFLSSSSLIHSPVSDILLLIPSRVFLISVIVFSLYVYYLVLLSLFKLILAFYPFCFQGVWWYLLSLFWIFFKVVFLFLFTYLYFCVSSLFLHLCSISMPFHYFFLTYRVWGLLFSGFKVEFFLPFGFCPPKVGPVVCVWFV